jgi:tRNA A-37 threonylcarbamoyl transferase component Bud32
MLAMAPIEKRLGRFTVFYYSLPVEPSVLLDALSRAEAIEGRGRGGIKVVEAEGLRLVSRKYMHGGLFRALTRDLFFDQGRATLEAEIMTHLRKEGFPTVAPFCVIAERLFPVKRLHLLTYMEEGSVELLERLQSSTRKERLRYARRLAELLWLMKKAGVYHPDFHLRNVLVAPGNRLVFLDFDRAEKRPVGDEDMKSMFRRLERFTDKMVRRGKLEADEAEKALFLRTYARLAGVDFAPGMKAAARRTSYRNRLGWFVESILYGRTR